jgi:serine/threonine protein kinase
MEYCQNGDLQSVIYKRRKQKQFFKEPEIWQMFMHIVLAIHELNRDRNKKILHRRITPDNILVSKNLTLKLCDFGHAKILDKDLSFGMTSMQANKYMAPE